MENKLFKFEKGWHGLSASLLINNKVQLYAGKASSFGISATYDHYDRSVTLQILNLCMGLSVWHTDTTIDF
jgi:hypothetical protein